MIGNGGHASVVRECVVTGNVIAIGDNATRKRLDGGEWGTAIHVSAVISPSAKISEGAMVMAGAVIQANARIGRHVIVNTCASVDHDCVIGDFAHIAPGCRLCGSVTVGEGAFLGVGCVVIPGIKIAPWARVRAGTVITEDV